MRTNSFFLGTKRIGRATAFAFGAAMICALLLLGLQAAKPAHAATTFTVNSTGDENDLDFPGGTFDNSSDGACDVEGSGTTGDQCTLRAAIQQANATSGVD
jgi:CSLREA domain-containing protein